MEERRHFTLIVAGENPTQMVKEFDESIPVPQYTVFEANNAGEYRKKYIKIYEELVKRDDITEQQCNLYKSVLDGYKNMDDIDFYLEITSGYEMDPETGNAISRVNPNSKFNSCRIGKTLAIPFINNENKEVYSARKKDIQWDKIHLANKEVYERAWDMVMEGAKPETDEEKIVYENMKNRTKYFEFFETRDNYVINNTAFWGYAFLSKENGWEEISKDDNQLEWVGNFYNRFINPLADNTLITIFECVRE